MYDAFQEELSPQSRHLGEALLDGVAEPVIIKDDGSRFVFVNDAACLLLCKSRTELIGRSDYDFLPKEEADKIVATDRLVLSTGEEHQLEETITVADGSLRTVLTKKRCGTFRVGTNPRKFLVAVLIDITELRQAEATLRASEEHYRSLVDLHPQVPWTADAAGHVLEVGPRWTELTGLTVQESLGSGWAKAVHPEDAATVTREWQRSITSGEPFDLEYRLVTKTGERRWFRARAATKRDDEGNVLRWYGILEDVDERRRATDALRESEARFRAIADDAPVVIWVAGSDEGTSFLSRLWRETTGQSEKEAEGFGWLDVIHPDDRGEVEKAFLQANKNKTPVRSEYRLRRADGSWAWVIDIGQPRFASDGTFLGYIGSVLDITERRTAELAQQESQAFITSIFDSSPDCVRVLDMDGRPLGMNKACRKIFGVGEDAPVAEQTWDLVGDPADAERVQFGWNEVRAGREARFEISVRDVEGNNRCMDVIAAPVRDRHGKPIRMLTIWRDVTDARRASEELNRAHKEAEAAASQLSSVLESTMDSVMSLDADWRIHYLNENAKKLLRIGDDAVGRPLWSLFPKEGTESFAEHCKEVMERRVRSFFEDYLPSLDIWVEANASPTQEGISIFFRDITERRRAEENRLLAQRQMVHMARHDMLTGLANRAFFRECFDLALAERRTSAGMAVLCMDLDGFKAVNDTFGHPTGDALLRQVSTRLVQIVRASDILARLGGDEFAIIQPLSQSTDDAVALAKRVIETLAQPFSIDGVTAVIGVSVGIAFAPKDGTSADELIKAADIALYSAKAGGRGTYRCFDEAMHAQLQAHQQLIVALREALQKGELELHYQPLVSLQTRQVTGCEALLRWHHPEKGTIPPSDFIPIAEETGLLVPIGEWILRQACREAAGWPSHISVAVNLSPVQFKHKALVRVVADALSASGLDPARLQLEITESVLLEESEHNLDILQALRDIGVKIALDDFGTGYSSLGYLRSFPFDKIKVDQAFVRDLPQGKESLAIVRAVAGLGHSLGMMTTVEGVETEEQLTAVNVEGFDEAQGYLFARPLPAAQIYQLLKTGTAQGELALFARQ
ncbi:MAG TPA: PAS domain S-box protein [Rhizobium sp.]|nr:PAS domain S-box protein [Rhizobium sp.]